MSDVPEALVERAARLICNRAPSDGDIADARQILAALRSEGLIYWPEELERVHLHPDDAFAYGLDKDTPVYRLRRDKP